MLVSIKMSATHYNFGTHCKILGGSYYFGHRKDSFKDLFRHLRCPKIMSKILSCTPPLKFYRNSYSLNFSTVSSRGGLRSSFLYLQEFLPFTGFSGFAPELLPRFYSCSFWDFWDFLLGFLQEFFTGSLLEYIPEFLPAFFLVITGIAFSSFSRFFSRGFCKFFQRLNI